MVAIDYNQLIPNNVNLSSDRRLQRALEKWQPEYVKWWKNVGPQVFKEKEVYLRTAVSAESGGWAHFDYVRMPDYRWGIFLTEAEPDRRIPAGDDAGKPVWQTVPGEYRAALKRIIVVQADTEPASVEQQRWLANTAPSLYDCRNLFQVNVEEGRHLWAMVYLLHAHFGRDGREEADELLERRSGDVDNPRILEAFNQPCEDWLSFFCFTTFTDRDGKYQLGALVESAFDPLSRSCRFMLTEEAHHLFVGEKGVGRIAQRACQLMKQNPNEEVRAQGGIDLPLIQRAVNFWFGYSQDLFGSEISSNAADYFASGMKGRWKETSKYEDHVARDTTCRLTVVEDGKLVDQDVPFRNAANEVLRADYEADCRKVVARWNKIIADEGVQFEFKLPSSRFFRHQGIYSEHHFDPDGNLIDEATWETNKHKWIPTPDDREYVKSLMTPVLEPGKMANYIAPPARGIHGQPIELEYVRTDV